MGKYFVVGTVVKEKRWGSEASEEMGLSIFEALVVL
jgi:hypothetical protein